MIAGLVELVRTGVATLTSMILFGRLLLIGGPAVRRAGLIAIGIGGRRIVSPVTDQMTPEEDEK